MPLPRGIGPPLPGALQTVLWMARPVEWLEHCRRRYGPTLLFDFAPMGPTLFVSSPAAVRAVFTADPSRVSAGEANVILRPIVGRRSLLLLDGPEHVRHRRLLAPPFHGERMHLYEGIVQRATEAAMRTWPVGQPFAVGPSLRDLTLRAILAAVFGVDDARMLALFGRYAEVGNSWLLFLPPLHRDLGPASPWGRVRRLRAETDAILYDVVARRRAAGGGDDVLSLLLAARDEAGAPLTDRELRDELVTLLVAGHETTATALEWALDRVLAHPEVHARVRDEALAGGALEYLDAVVKETHRVRPVVPNVARRLHAPLAFDGHAMPTGTYVAPCVYLAHRREETYPDPLAFRPERFLGHKPDPYAWMPFGGGARRCIGMAFALLEMRVALATMFAGADLARAAPRDARIARRGVTLAPRGFRLIARPRA